MTEFGTVRIACKGSTEMHLLELVRFQGELKTLSEENYSRFRDLLIDLGFSSPFHVWDDGAYPRLLDGHQRLTTLLRMSEEGYFVPDVFPVVEVEGSSEQEARRKVLALASQFGDVQREALVAFAGLADLTLDDVAGDFRLLDVDLTPLETPKVEPAGTVGQTDEDSVPGEADALRCVPGQTWRLGDHILHVGDSFDDALVDRLLAGRAVALTMTDPPYEFSKARGGGVFADSAKDRAMKEIEAIGIDKFDPTRLKPRGRTQVYCCNRPLVPVYIGIAAALGSPWDIAVYHKVGAMPNYGSHLMTDLEYVMVLGEQKPRQGLPYETYSKLFSGRKDQDNTVAWSKPVALCRRFVELYSEPGEVVFEPFCGSGSTLIACEATGRACVAFELVPKYADMTIRRWEQFTGRQAELVQGA